MSRIMTFEAHARATLVLGLPLIGSSLAQMMLHVTDTVLMGWYGVTELAAVVLGSSSFFIIFVLGSGFAKAVMPMVAQALGQGNEVQVRRDTRMGMWLSVLFGVLCYPVFWQSGAILQALGQKAEVAGLAQQFMRIAGLGMIPALLGLAMTGYLSALERTRVMLWTTVVAVLVNLLVAWALIFGRFGLPELGVQGAAMASVWVQVMTFGVLALYAARVAELRRFALFQRFWRADWPAFARVFRLGWPIGMTGLAEAGLFQASALMMGWIGTVELAAHGIAMQVVALAFMVHVGLSNAATVRIGRAEGAGDVRGLRDGAKVAIGMSFGFGLVMVVVFLVCARPLVSLFVDQRQPETAQIVAFGAVLVAVATLFQLADAMQVMALGLLRGIRDTRVPMIAAAVSYWLIGIPASYGMAFPLGLGGVGLWLGLVVGLVVAASMLMWRFWQLAPREEPPGNPG